MPRCRACGVGRVAALLAVVSGKSTIRDIHSMFSRPLMHITQDLHGPLLPTFLSLLDGSTSGRVLEIGCGSGRALLQLTADLEQRWPERTICAIGTTNTNYTKRFVDRNLTSLQLRHGGLQATIEEGALSVETMQELHRQYKTPIPRSAPTIVDLDYYEGLPFASSEFELLLAGAAMKLRNESRDFPIIGDEIVRVLRPGGSALVQMFTQSGHMVFAKMGMGIPWKASPMFAERRTQRVLHEDSDGTVPPPGSNGRLAPQNRCC